MRSVVALLMLASVGCTYNVTISGAVDGDPVRGGRDALFDTVEIPFGPFGEVEVTGIILTDFPNACEVLEGLLDNEETDCDDRCDDYLRVAETYNIPTDDAWTVFLVANTSGGKVGRYTYEDLPIGSDTYGLTSFTSYDTSALSSRDACIAACEDPDDEVLPADSEGLPGGSFEITAETTEDIMGEFAFGEVPDDDEETPIGDSVSGSFTATPCNTGDWLPFF